MNLNRTVFLSEAICSLYSLELRPPLHVKEPKIANISDWYAIAVYSLPDEVNGTNIGVFQDFFDEYGDHIITKCKRVGGTVM
jgi:hypothetical protein